MAVIVGLAAPAMFALLLAAWRPYRELRGAQWARGAV